MPTPHGHRSRQRPGPLRRGPALWRPKLKVLPRRGSGDEPGGNNPATASASGCRTVTSQLPYSIDLTCRAHSVESAPSTDPQVGHPKVLAMTRSIAAAPKSSSRWVEIGFFVQGNYPTSLMPRLPSGQLSGGAKLDLAGRPRFVAGHQSRTGGGHKSQGDLLKLRPVCC